MEKKKKALTAGLIASAVMLFGFILLAVWLTGGRDIPEFSPEDWKYFWICMGLDLVNLVVMFVLAVRVGKLNKPQTPPKPTHYEKSRMKRGLVINGIAVAFSFAAFLLGSVLRKAGHDLPDGLGLKMTLAGIALAVLLVLVQFLAYKMILRKLNGMSVAEGQAFTRGSWEHAEETARGELRVLRASRRSSWVISGLMGLLGLFMSFLGGQIVSLDWGIALFWVGALFIEVLLHNIWLPRSEAVMRDWDVLISRADYPELYALAEKAAAERGIKGEIVLGITTGCTASITKVGRKYVLQLSAILLNTLTREELYTILLHEFTHYDREQERANREAQYMDWLQEGRNPGILSQFMGIFFMLPDSVYIIHYNLWRLASSIAIEVRADRAMAVNPTAAASALLKLKYYDLYDWECYDRELSSFFAEEKPTGHALRDDIERFLGDLPKRIADWEALAEKEIIARNATHPTTIMRVRSLGLEQFPAVDALPEGTYAAECRKACEFMDSLMGRDEKEYADGRKHRYLKPLEKVKAWEEAGKPLIPEDYADMIESLRMIGRSKDAYDLACRAVEELPAIGGCYGRFVRGIYRLHAYDKSGIEDLYAAMEENHNYIEEGLEMIGHFCCMMGLQQELEEYRTRAVEQMQRVKDESDPMLGLSRKDDLSQEHLPEGMLEEILDFIRENAKDTMQNVYLVHKTVSPTFATSAVVLRFKEGTDPELADEVHHKVFRFLDTAYDWQFTLTDYTDVPKGLLERVEGSCVFEG